MDDFIRDDEINNDRIEAIFKSAFMRPERATNGDVIIRDGGLIVFMQVDTGRKMITLQSLFGLKSSFSEINKLKFANELNIGLIIVCFSVRNSDQLWCEYQFFYEGGTTPFNIVNTYKRFASVCLGAIERDTNDMIGGD